MLYVFKCIFICMQLPLACKFNIIWEIRVSKKKKVLLVTDNRAIPTKTETWLAFCPTVPLAFLTYQKADFTLSFVLHFCLADNTIISIINFFFFFFLMVFAYLAGNPVFFFSFLHSYHFALLFILQRFYSLSPILFTNMASLLESHCLARNST